MQNSQKSYHIFWSHGIFILSSEQLNQQRETFGGKVLNICVLKTQLKHKELQIIMCIMLPLISTVEIFHTKCKSSSTFNKKGRTLLIDLYLKFKKESVV